MNDHIFRLGLSLKRKMKVIRKEAYAKGPFKGTDGSVWFQVTLADGHRVKVTLTDDTYGP